MFTRDPQVTVAIISGFFAILVAALGYLATMKNRSTEKEEAADNALVKGLEQQLQVKDDMIRLRDDRLLDKDEDLADCHKVIAEKDKEIAHLKRIIGRLMSGEQDASNS